MSGERLTGRWWPTATSGRLTSVGTCPEPHRDKGNAEETFWNSAHHCSYHSAALCGAQLGARSAQRHRMCPIFRKIKLSLLSETAKPFKGAAVLRARIAWMQGFAMDCKIFFSSVTIVYLNFSPCQLLKGKKISVWFCSKKYLGWILY